MKTCITLLTCFFLSTSLFAESISNLELLKMCKESSPSSQSFCYGFIISAANAAQFYRNIVDVEKEYIDICFPDKISNQEITELYIKWAEAHPDLGSGPAFIGVSTSFSTKYSCQNKEKNNTADVYK